MIADAGNDDAEVGTSDFGIKVQTSADKPDCDALRDIDQGDKALATARAQLAIAGWTLHELSSGGCAPSYFAARLATSRVLPDRRAVALFARFVGGAR